MSKQTVNATIVSTHSRLKAAACPISPVSGERYSFNTQPPEGGCIN